MPGAVKPLAAIGVTDETTALTLAQYGRVAARQGFAATSVSLYLTWNLAGLDVVGPAAFLVLIWPRLQAGRTERLVALGGVAIALATTLAASSSMAWPFVTV